MATLQQNEEFVPAAELRRRFNVSDACLRAWRRRGLPFIGGAGVHPRYRVSEVEQWLRERSPREQSRVPVSEEGD